MIQNIDKGADVYPHCNQYFTQYPPTNEKVIP